MNPPDDINSSAGRTPTASSSLNPPVITNPSARLTDKPSLWRSLAAASLSLCLSLFLVGGVVSTLDDSLVLLFGLHLLTGVSAVLAFISLFALLLLYGLIGVTPLIPKRVFLPIIVFNLLGLLVVFPTMIYRFPWMLQLDWLLSLIQVAVILGVIYWLRGDVKLRWLVIEVKHLGTRIFSGWNLTAFLLLNILVLLPAVVAYLALCASLTLGHFTDGFLTLRPGGLIMQARTYARNDGKTIVLFPMSHIAEADFYQAVSHSSASNMVVLLEGVTDEQNLLTNGISYRRAAKSLGLAEQHDDLNIVQGELVRADVDVHDFTPGTIALLNLVGAVQARGLNVGTLLPLLQNSPTPDLEKQLFADILLKRNDHLLQELRERLKQSDHFLIPWGAAHMPGIAEEIQKSGFHLVETRDYVSIRFGSKKHTGSGIGKVPSAGDPR
jgi:hypothetical protein